MDLPKQRVGPAARGMAQTMHRNLVVMPTRLIQPDARTDAARECPPGGAPAQEPWTPGLQDARNLEVP